MSTTATLSAHDLIEAYLQDLQGAPSTVRQRRWAAGDLLASTQGAPAPATGADLLNPVNVEAWIASARASGASLPGLRARAATARAITTWAHAHALLDPQAGTAPGAARLPAAPQDPGVGAGVQARRARHLLAAAGDGPPWPVHHQVWDRFAAHAHVLAATGATATELAALTTAGVDLSRAGVHLGDNQWYDLPDPGWRALERWMATRTALVAANVRGADPHACWLRVRPASNKRTGAVAPAGLPISVRGLRLAFDQIVAIVAMQDAQVTGVQLRDVRALGRAVDSGLPIPTRKAGAR